MEARSHLLTLANIYLAEILSYLTPSDVLLRLSLTCKDSHKIITTSPYIIKSLFENLFGRKLVGEANCNLTIRKFKEIIDSFSVVKKFCHPLPFFGFRSNGGTDRDSYRYLFDKVFEFRNNNNLVCTKSGEDFDIEGVLSEDFKRETRCIQNIIDAIDQTPLAQQRFHELFSLKKSLKTYGALGLLESNPLPQNHPMIEETQTLWGFKQEFAKYLQDRDDKYHIELPCQKMLNSIGLIQSCHLRRGIGTLTCPVKTLAAFASVDEEIRSSPLAALFSQCKTSNDLFQLLKDHKDDLPSISQTSIKRVAELSPNIKYIDEENDGVEFVVFNSNGKKQDAIPLFWVNFNKAIEKNLFLNFRNCHFSGRYVMLKLIRCEDLRAGSSIPDEPKNVDINFCCFSGPVIDF